MKDNLIGTCTLVLNATASEVWDALTKPELIKKYFFGTDTHTDWKVGSPIKFSGEWEGKKYEDKGTVLVNNPQKLIKYKYWSSLSGKEDLPENYQIVSYHLLENEDTTTLTIKQEGIQSEKEKEHSEKNWKNVLKGLQNLVEKNKISA